MGQNVASAMNGHRPIFGTKQHTGRPVLEVSVWAGMGGFSFEFPPNGIPGTAHHAHRSPLTVYSYTLFHPGPGVTFPISPRRRRPATWCYSYCSNVCIDVASPALTMVLPLPFPSCVYPLSAQMLWRYDARRPPHFLVAVEHSVPHRHRTPFRDPKVCTSLRTIRSPRGAQSLRARHAISMRPRPCLSPSSGHTSSTRLAL